MGQRSRAITIAALKIPIVHKWWEVIQCFISEIYGWTLIPNRDRGKKVIWCNKSLWNDAKVYKSWRKWVLRDNEGLEVNLRWWASLDGYLFKDSVDPYKSSFRSLKMCSGHYEGTRLCPLIPFMNIKKVLDKGMSNKLKYCHRNNPPDWIQETISKEDEVVFFYLN